MEMPNAITEAKKIVEENVALHTHKTYWTSIIANAMIDFHNKCENFLKSGFQQTIIETHINNKVA